ncbi:MAG TPA: hypothetical protein PK490_14260 [Prosthecobacter sp.]|nr:hypothetical protein [Prosthecobacter sp.]HRK15441.1 hypothetical protein [Prosthecobacter sp.]
MKAALEGRTGSAAASAASLGEFKLRVQAVEPPAPLPRITPLNRA